jgi:hypothetical protein
MADLPVLQAGAPQAAPIAGTTLNAEAVGAPGRALVGFGDAIQSAAAVAGDTALHIQNAKNVAATADAARQMDEAFAQYQVEMQKQTDESTWTDDWMQRAGKLRVDLLKSAAGPAAKRAIDEDLKNWASKTTTQVRGQQSARTTQRQQARIGMAAEYMFKNGDYERGAAFIDSGEKAGLYFPEEAQALRDKGHEIVDFNQANRAIGADPIAAGAALDDKTPTGRWRNFTSLDENTRQALKVEAERATAHVREDTYRSVIDRRNAGTIVPPDELQRYVDQKLLTAPQMKSILAEQRRSGDDPEVYNDAATAFTAADHYVHKDDPTNKRFTEILMMGAGLPPTLRDEVERRLRGKTAKTGENTALKLANDYVEGQHRGGFYGNASVISGRALNQKEFEAANRRLVELKQEIARFTEANPTASATDVLTHIQTLDVKKRTDPTPIVDAITGVGSGGL